MDIKQVKPYNKKDDKTHQLIRMFDAISGKYDGFNDIMSMGMAHNWRRKALLQLLPYPHSEILDVACGTADISIKAFRYLRPKHVTGIDVSEKMMAVGEVKIEKAGLADRITLQVADVSRLTFPDESFDAAITSFGIRNFDKLEQSLQQIHRVLRKKGKFVILEMNEPQTPIIKQAYKVYTNTLIPFAVKTFNNDSNAYHYLTDSMEAFPQGKELISIIKENGFDLVSYNTFFLGVCGLYVVEKV